MQIFLYISKKSSNFAAQNQNYMAKTVIDKIEYLVLLIAEFAHLHKVSEVQSYRYLQQYGALALCEKHYNVMHTLSVEDNLQTLQEYCKRKGGNL